MGAKCEDGGDTIMNVVACVYWKGRFKNREKVYTPEWVYILKNMVTRNMPANEAFRFVCLTNVPDEFNGTIETIPLKHNWPGWWGKLELFRPGVFEDGDRVFYIDLDSIIIQSIKPFFDFEADIAIMKSSDVKRYGTQWKDRHGDLAIVKYGSTAMIWTVPFGREFYDEFSYANIVEKKRVRGDQDWIALCNPELAMFPSAWIRKLRNISTKHEPPKDLKILLPMAPGMYLKNKTAAEMYPWIAKVWQ